MNDNKIKVVTVRLSVEDHKKIKEEAKKVRIPISMLLRNRALESMEKENG